MFDAKLLWLLDLWARDELHRQLVFQGRDDHYRRAADRT